MSLKKGDLAPDFTLPCSSGKDFHLYDEIGEGLILYFYPKDFTPGCTTEACSFRDSFSSFNDLGIRIVGVSTDSIETHNKFISSYKLPFELLADESGKISAMYDAMVPFLNISKRISYLIGPDKRIIDKYSNPVMARSHVRNMIKAGMSLKP